MIVNLRGTNGSGKSTIVRSLLNSYNSKPDYGCLGPRRPQAYEINNIPGVARPVFVLGPYPYQTAIGGCDLIQPYDWIIRLLNTYAPKGHVVFEGALISDNYGSIGKWLEAHNEAHGDQSVVLFLNTSLEDCIKRVKARTKDAGTKHIEPKFNRIAKVREGMIEAGKVSVFDISVETGKDLILELLRGDLKLARKQQEHVSVASL